MLSNIVPKQGSEQNRIKTDQLKVRGNTLIFQNSIYQISNISSISVLNLSTEKAMPGYIVIVLIVGIILLFAPEVLKLVGIAAIAIAGYLIYQHYQNKVDEKYGLSMTLNSGEFSVFLGRDESFLKQVAITLHNIMNEKNIEDSINFNFDQRQIVDINNATGSTIVTGSVSGDVVNSVN
jgi:hypothetical protein